MVFWGFLSDNFLELLVSFSSGRRVVQRLFRASAEIILPLFVRKRSTTGADFEFFFFVGARNLVTSARDDFGFTFLECLVPFW